MERRKEAKEVRKEATEGSDRKKQSQGKKGAKEER